MSISLHIFRWEYVYCVPASLRVCEFCLAVEGCACLLQESGGFDSACICVCVAPLPPEGGSSLEDLHLAFPLGLVGMSPGVASREDVLIFLVYET